jgi:phage terminase large subunit-like protein
MAEASDTLAACLKLNRSTRNILYGATNSWYRALSNEPGGKEGLNIHACIIDELHVWKGRDLWDTLRYGYRSRRQPLQFVITTAGDDDQSVCYSELERARQILSGAIRDDAYFALVYEASPEDNWTDEATWQKANPSIGQTFTVQTLREDADAAKGRASEEAVFKRYSLNIWSKAANPWLSIDDWQKNQRAFSGEDLAGMECYGGLDLSRTRDMTALALVFPWEEDGRQVYRQLVRFWLPEAAVSRYKDHIDIPKWVEAGWLEIMGDTYDQVEAAIVEAAEQFRMVGLAYDRMYARDFTEKLQQEHGIMPAEFSQTIMQYAGPTAEYERLLIHDALHHNGNPVLAWQAGHVQVKQDANANKRPVKPPGADYRKIDGIVAGIMALGYAMTQPANESAYASPGMLYADAEPENEEYAESV